MKTKLVLMAMALPALFAACTSDEFVEPAQGNFNGRALLDGLTVNVDQEADTRFAWGNYQWKFEAGDQFGAAVTDPTTFGTVVNTHMLGNYIFSQAADGSYSTTSQMYEGTYFFYSYPDFQSKATRDLIEFDLGVQKADLTKPEEVISNTQLFFSPLYEIKAKTVGTALPLKFYPYWSVAAFKIKNNTGAAFKISQIVLNGSGFITKGEIDAAKIKDAKLIYSIAKDANEYSLPKDMTAEKYAKGMATADIVKNGTSTTTNSIALNCGNYELADGKEIVAYMSVPASATSTAVSGVNIIVNVEGVSKNINVSETETVEGETTNIVSAGMEALKFERGKTKAVFGFETDQKTMKALVVGKKNLQSASGFYVDNKAALLNVINANRGDVAVYNMGDLVIDKEVADALNLNSAANITFNNPIDVAVSEDATISKTTFAGGVTVKSGNVTFGASTVLGAEQIMTVEGGKVVLNDITAGQYSNPNSSIIVNGGELVVAKAEAKITKIEVKSGTLTLNGESQTIGDDKIEALTFGDASAQKQKATKLNVSLSGNGSKTLTVDRIVTMPKETTTTVAKGNIVMIGDGVKLENAGEIENSGDIKKNGDAGTGFLVNTVTGTIRNGGTIEKVKNSGFITNTDVWYSSVTVEDVEKPETGDSKVYGYIDNTVGAAVKGISDTEEFSTVYRVFEGEDPVVPETEDLIVFKNVTFTKDLTKSTVTNVLFLGTTDIKANVVFGYDGVEVQIGLNIVIAKKGDTVTGITGDTNYQTLAEEILGKDLHSVDKLEDITDYKKSVVTRVYEGASLQGNSTASILNNYGGESLNRGEVVFGGIGNAGTWTPNAAAQYSKPAQGQQQ